MSRLIKRGIALCFCVSLLAGVAMAEDACFAVTAYNYYGESAKSEVICSSLDVNPLDTFVVSWDASENAAGYRVYYKQKDSTEWFGSIDVGDVTSVPIPAIFTISILCKAEDEL